MLQLFGVSQCRVWYRLQKCDDWWWQPAVQTRSNKYRLHSQGTCSGDLPQSPDRDHRTASWQCFPLFSSWDHTVQGNVSLNSHGIDLKTKDRIWRTQILGMSKKPRDVQGWIFQILQRGKEHGPSGQWPQWLCGLGEGVVLWWGAPVCWPCVGLDVWKPFRSYDLIVGGFTRVGFWSIAVDMAERSKSFHPQNGMNTKNEQCVHWYSSLVPWPRVCVNMIHLWSCRNWVTSRESRSQWFSCHQQMINHLPTICNHLPSICQPFCQLFFNHLLDYPRSCPNSDFESLWDNFSWPQQLLLRFDLKSCQLTEGWQLRGVSYYQASWGLLYCIARNFIQW